jgi:hypothetical protein
MKTYLDTIVEEELRAWPEFRDKGHVGPCRSIAERAFRHGVEQFARFGYVAEGRRHIVQPEPVGEKPIPAPHCPARCGGPHSLRASDGTYHCNTRKSERRRLKDGDWFCSLGGGLRFYTTAEHTPLWRDRRSGKDRRKA